jgi:hypothetical protein
MSAAWQPIETAPKDGTWFVAVAFGYHPAIVRWHKEGDREGWQDDEDGSPWSPALWELTHWLDIRPIPGGGR